MSLFCRSFCIILVLFLFSIPATAQPGDELLEKFNESLMVNFIAPLRAEGVDITPVMRSKFIGYQYDRLWAHAGEFDSDRQRMQTLKSALEDFVTQAGGKSAWSTVLNGMAGHYASEVEALFGGSVYVPPIFTSPEQLVRDRKDILFTAARWNEYQHNGEVMQVADSFLTLLKQKSFTDAGGHLAGRFSEEWQQVLEQMEADDDFHKEMTTFADNLESRPLSGTMSGTDPPMVRLLFNINEMDEWVNYEMYLLRDAGQWKIVAFDEE